MSSEIARAYDAWAHVYDEDANATRDLDAAVLRALPPDVVHGDVLELGCGTGKNTVFLAERARTVVALDFSEGMLAKARARSGTSGVRFLPHDVRDPLPVPAASADFITADLVLEHVERLEPVFAEAARVLRPGGRLHVCELHPFRQLLGKQARFTPKNTTEVVLVEAHRHAVSDYLNAAVAAGLALESVREARGDGDAADALPRVIAFVWRRTAP